MSAELRARSHCLSPSGSRMIGPSRRSESVRSLADLGVCMACAASHTGRWNRLEGDQGRKIMRIGRRSLWLAVAAALVLLAVAFAPVTKKESVPNLDPVEPDIAKLDATVRASAAADRRGQDASAAGPNMVQTEPDIGVLQATRPSEGRAKVASMKAYDAGRVPVQANRDAASAPVHDLAPVEPDIGEVARRAPASNAVAPSAGRQ